MFVFLVPLMLTLSRYLSSGRLSAQAFHFIDSKKFFVAKLSAYFTPCSTVSIVNLEHVITGWGRSLNPLMSNDPLLLFETSQLFDHDLVSGAKGLIAINEYDPPQLGRRSKCSSQ